MIQSGRGAALGRREHRLGVDGLERRQCHHAGQRRPAVTVEDEGVAGQQEAEDLTPSVGEHALATGPARNDETRPRTRLAFRHQLLPGGQAFPPLREAPKQILLGAAQRRQCAHPPNDDLYRSRQARRQAGRHSGAPN